MIHELIDNAAILLALGLMYDVVAYKTWVNNKITKSLSGVILGLVGVFVMLNPWELRPGLFFDTRSIVLSVGGLFFGTIPALIAALMTGVLRILQGGVGMYVGLGVIATSATYGVMLRSFKLRGEKEKRLVKVTPFELFGLGMVVHITMLLWLLILPKPDAYAVLQKVGISIMTIFPLGTLFLGKFLISRIKRLAADRALKASEQRYRNFVDNTSDCLFISDFQGRILDVNESACITLGYNRDESLKLTASDIINNFSETEFMKSRHEVMAGSLESLTLSYKRKNGQVFPVEVRVRAIGSDDHPLFLASSRDISHRKQAEAALKKSEKKFRILSVSSPIGIFLLDRHGKVTYINQKYSELTGIQSDTIMHTGWVANIHSHDKALVRAEWNKTIESGSEFHLDYRWLHEDGKVVWTHCRIVRVKSQGPEDDIFIGTLTNITKQKQAEDALRVSEQQFKAYTNQSIDGIGVADMEGRYTFVNPAFCQMMGYSEQELLTMTVFDVKAPEQDKSSFDRSKGSEEGLPIEVLLQRKDGSTFLAEVVGKMIEIEGAKKVLGIVRDLTIQKAEEERRKVLEKQLQQSQKLEAIGTMVGGISHELNNILQSIFLYGGLVQDELPPDQELYRNMQKLLDQGERARDIVKQILTFSRKSEMDMKPRAIADIIMDALALERASFPTNINIQQKIDLNCGKVLCDKTQIHQIVINLCNNAQHAMRETGGTLTVSLSQIKTPWEESSPIGDVLELKICDTGHGMHKEVMDRIFDPFFTTKAVGEGTGLGLSVIHGLIEMMGGRITVHSKVSEGTTFIVYLPVISNVYEDAPEATKDTSRTGYQTILFVDDDEGVRMVTEKALRRKGFRVEVAREGLHALELLKDRAKTFDLIVTDLSMPNMSGVELSQEIRETGSEIPILLSTGKLNSDDIEHYKSAGINGFIQKPWRIKQLLEKIKELDS